MPHQRLTRLHQRAALSRQASHRLQEGNKTTPATEGDDVSTAKDRTARTHSILFKHVITAKTNLIGELSEAEASRERDVLEAAHSLRQALVLELGCAKVRGHRARTEQTHRGMRMLRERNIKDKRTRTSLIRSKQTWTEQSEKLAAYSVWIDDEDFVALDEDAAEESTVEREKGRFLGAVEAAAEGAAIAQGRAKVGELLAILQNRACESQTNN